MSDTKTNVALGASAVAIVATVSSFVYTNKQIDPVLERLDSVEEDLTNIAISLNELRSVYNMEIARTKSSLKSLGKRVDRLDKKFKTVDGLHDELISIKHDLLGILSSQTDISDVPETIVQKKKEPKEMEVKKRPKKKETKKTEDSDDDDDDDDDDLDDYINGLKK
jgi:hypothetical protein